MMTKLSDFTRRLGMFFGAGEGVTNGGLRVVRVVFSPFFLAWLFLHILFMVAVSIPYYIVTGENILEL